MIFEKLNFGFDIKQLVSHLETNVFPLPRVQAKSLAGWSVLSSNGSYTDGWHSASAEMRANMSPQEITAIAEASGGKANTQYKHPTEICTGYLAEVMKIIAQKGFHPLRARISCLPPGRETTWHRDAPENIYCGRLHIPLITNPNCFFETREGAAHLPADGSIYFLMVNCEHRAYNHGSSDRYHLIMDAVDSKGITKFHSFQNWLKTSNRPA